jgi:hypothetical protein
MKEKKHALNNVYSQPPFAQRLKFCFIAAGKEQETALWEIEIIQGWFPVSDLLGVSSESRFLSEVHDAKTWENS